MKNILIIPHYYSGNMRIRSVEFAKALACRNYNVFVLRWYEYPNNSGVYGKLKYYIDNFINALPIEKKDNVYFISLPLIMKPVKPALWFNSYILNKIIPILKLDLIINAAAYYFDIDKKKYSVIRYIYDLVDDHLDTCLLSNKKKYGDFIKKQMLKADRIAAVSYSLKNKIYGELKLYSVVIPNGAETGKIRQSTAHKNNEIIEKYKLDGFKIIGYIGNFGSWSGLNFLIDAFKLYKQKFDNQSKLFIVGPVNDTSIDIKKNSDNDIIFTGGQPPDKIYDFLSVMDLGVLPFDRIPFTDNSFPIKIIEYGAARLPVISRSLTELTKHNLPFIKYADTVEEWSDLFNLLERGEWLPEWDKIIDDYSWEKLIDRFINE